jgi:hypothetical protein
MGLPAGWLAKFVFGGQISSDDDWSVGFWLELGTPDPTSADVTDLTSHALSTFNSAVWGPAGGSIKGSCAPATNLQTCKSYVYNNGVLTFQSQATQAASAGTATTLLPAYVAAVFSLRTESFGRSARGRVYMPMTGAVLSGGKLQLQLSQTHVDNVAGWLHNARFGAWGASYTGTTNPVVVSRVGSGMARSITDVIVDSIPDTQHGRESKAVATSVLNSAVSLAP